MINNLIKKTKSTCPVCRKEIKANIPEENGKAVMEKKCDQHGDFKAVVVNELRFFNIDHVALDGSANPFFETMMINEQIRSGLKQAN